MKPMKDNFTLSNIWTGLKVLSVVAIIGLGIRITRQLDAIDLHLYELNSINWKLEEMEGKARLTPLPAVPLDAER